MTRYRGSGLGHRRAAAAFAFLVTAPVIVPSHAQTSPNATAACMRDSTSGDCELVLPPVCSRDPAASTAPATICEVTNLTGPLGGKRVRIGLQAVTAGTTVGGYGVTTENYNGKYLSPVVEALPGDAVAAQVQNSLAPREPSGTQASAHAHHAKGNPTNLHFFHGGVVTPRNARRADDPKDTTALQGNGDNVYTYLKPGDPAFTYEVPIPHRLDARAIEGSGVIPHPSGLNWYHSHMHGRSSDQVMGGLSGLLSVGDARANVVACRPDPADASKCKDDPNATADLKARTDVRYALLRDIALDQITAHPEDTAATKTATWAPGLKDWKKENGDCKVWPMAGGQPDANPRLRRGYCQPDQNKAWLFTVNGQRFPTINVAGGRNLLLRLGNLSPNVVYWLELANEQDDADRQDLLLIGIDGVVPAKVSVASPNRQPVRASAVKDLLFMPASRAEIFIRNDCRRTEPKTYVLRTKGLNAGRPSNPLIDIWPEIQLMRITLAASTTSCTDEIALNAVAGQNEFAAMLQARTAARVATRPKGCVDDIDPAQTEHRLVTFSNADPPAGSNDRRWSVLTEIRRPPDGTALPAIPYDSFVAVADKTVGVKQPDGSFLGIPFEDYDLGDGKVDWDNTTGNRPHVCVFVDPDNPSSTKGHQQLWVLKNETGELHNFHIHQMKFRLATADELTKRFKIDLTDEAPDVCSDQPTCKGTVYKLYDRNPVDENTKWHDTIPMPPSKRTYVIMSFVAEEQVGRYVFHCHILKHEDTGLMAPIEVWKPQSASLLPNLLQ